MKRVQIILDISEDDHAMLSDSLKWFEEISDGGEGAADAKALREEIDRQVPEEWK